MVELWIYIAVGAYLLNAFAFVIDKYLLAAPIPRPFAYSFWISALSAPVFLLIPFFDIFIPSPVFFAVAFSSGLLFFIGIIFLYTAVRKSDVSIAATQVGVFTAIFTYLFSLLVLGENALLGNIIALSLLVLGMFFLGTAGRGILQHALIAGATLGLSFVLLKWSFDTSGFINGLFWTRIGFIGAAALSLLFPKARTDIVSSFRGAPASSKWIFVGNKLLAGSGFILLYVAILLGSVAVVNALLGFQFLFVFLLALLLQNRLPGIRENLDRKILVGKLAGIALVVAGFLAILT